MDLTQLAQIFSILSGIVVISKLFFDIKADIIEIKTELKKNSQFVEYKYEEVEKRLEKLEEIYHDAK